MLNVENWSMIIFHSYAERKIPHVFKMAIFRHREGAGPAIEEYTNCWAPLLQAGCMDQRVWKLGSGESLLNVIK